MAVKISFYYKTKTVTKLFLSTGDPMSSSFSDLSEEVRFVMHKTLSQPGSMNNPSKSPSPTDESSSTKEPDDSEVNSSEGMAELH